MFPSHYEGDALAGCLQDEGPVTELPRFLLGPVRSVLRVQTNGARSGQGLGSHGLHSPLGTAAQFLCKPPYPLWAYGIPETLTLNRGGQRRRREGQ